MSAKDSSAMLKAGAREVFYIQAGDNHLLKAFKKLRSTISSDNLIICESGGLREFVVPDVFLVIHNTSNITIKSKEQKLIPMADAYINRSEDIMDFDLGRVVIRDKEWILT
jgi:hypothetical protein